MLAVYEVATWLENSQDLEKPVFMVPLQVIILLG